MNYFLCQHQDKVHLVYMFSGADPGDRVGGTEWSIVRILARGRELGAWEDLNRYLYLLNFLQTSITILLKYRFKYHVKNTFWKIDPIYLRTCKLNLYLFSITFTLNLLNFPDFEHEGEGSDGVLNWMMHTGPYSKSAYERLSCTG